MLSVTLRINWFQSLSRNLSKPAHSLENGKTIKAYAKHILRMGSSEERKEALSLIKTKISLKDASLEILL